MPYIPLDHSYIPLEFGFFKMKSGLCLQQIEDFNLSPVARTEPSSSGPCLSSTLHPAQGAAGPPQLVSTSSSASPQGLTFLFSFVVSGSQFNTTEMTLRSLEMLQHIACSSPRESRTKELLGTHGLRFHLKVHNHKNHSRL